VEREDRRPSPAGESLGRRLGAVQEDPPIQRVPGEGGECDVHGRDPGPEVGEA